MKHRGFTLIELLVVIAIIAILAAILFPVFAQAKAAAKKTASLSNIKQASLGVIMYTGDYDDMYDSGAGICWFYPTDGGWAWDTQPYMKSLPLLRDPSDPMSKRDHYTWELPPNNPGVSISFASNGYLWQDSQNGYSTKVGGVMGIDQSPQPNRCNSTGWMTSGRTNGGQVSKPAETIMLAPRAGGLNIWGTDAIISGVTWWDHGCPGSCGGAGLIPNGAAANTPYMALDAASVSYQINATMKWGAIFAPYANTAPFVYCDGHAKAQNPAATNPNPTNQYITGPWYGTFPGGHDPQNQWDAYRP
jgi:prepilin-type N-terminal cleavage/methylation domain-containing protein